MVLLLPPSSLVAGPDGVWTCARAIAGAARGFQVSMRSGVPRGRMGNSKLGLAPQRPVALRFWHRDCWTAIIQSLRHFLSNVSSRWASGFWFRAFRVLGLLPGVLFATLGAWAADPVISELAAASQTVLKDEDGEYPDWIELHNPGVDRLNLRDWSLTDDPGEPRKWRFPERVLEPGGYLVVFASGKNRVGAGTTCRPACSNRKRARGMWKACVTSATRPMPFRVSIGAR